MPVGVTPIEKHAKNTALQDAADYCWERARDCLVARDRTQGDGVNPVIWQAKADAFTEAAQAIQGKRSRP